MYGVHSEVFLHYHKFGVDKWLIEQAGAPRHALHAWRVSFPHPDGTVKVVEANLPPDLQRWWDSPEVLPRDGWFDNKPNQTEGQD